MLMKRNLDFGTFIEWLRAAFDFEKIIEENELGGLVLKQDGQDFCFGEGTELGFSTGPFFNDKGVWIGRGMCSEESKEVNKEILKRYSDTTRYYIQPETEWTPLQIYLKFVEENIDDIQSNAEEEMEQEAKISLLNFLKDGNVKV